MNYSSVPYEKNYKILRYFFKFDKAPYVCESLIEYMIFHMDVILYIMEQDMGLFKEEITLANATDRGAARRGMIPESEIRSITVKARPDTGAWTLVINEEIRQTLGLEIVGTRPGTLADGTTGAYGLTEPVEVHWKNREAVCQAAVLPASKNVLLGAMPLEGLDLYVDPVNQHLAGVHGDEPVGELC